MGGGGCAWPKHVIATRPDVRVDVLEADPEIIDIARRYFFLDKLAADYDLPNSGRLNLICADGASYLASLAKKLPVPNAASRPASWLYGRSPRRYDVIVMDAFKAGEADAALAQAPSICDAHRCLAEGGVLMANVVSTLTGPGSSHLHAYLSLLKQAFRHVYVAPLGGVCGEGADNVVVLATDGSWQFDAAQEWQV
mgnify:FL=1